MFRTFGLLLGLATAVVLGFMVSNRCCLLRGHLIEAPLPFTCPSDCSIRFRGVELAEFGLG